MFVEEDLSKTTANIDTVAGKWIKKAERTEPKKEAKHLKVLQKQWQNNGGDLNVNL